MDSVPGNAAAGGRWPTISDYWRGLFGQKVWRVSIDPGFGCPNRAGGLGEGLDAGGCIFCDPASFALSNLSTEPVAAQIKRQQEKLRRSGYNLFAAYFQPRTNTFASLEVLERVWAEAAAVEDVVALCVGTRPDCVDDDVLDAFARAAQRFGDHWLELGLQSANDETLRLINRGHDAAAFADAVKRAHARNIRVCAHVILGLPGEGAQDERATAELLAKLGVEGVKLHQLAVIGGTPLEALYRQGKLDPLGEEQYIERALEFVRRLPDGVVLHRLVGNTLGGQLAPHFDRYRIIRVMRDELGIGGGA